MWQATSSTPTLIEAATYWNGQMVSYFDGTGTTFTHYDAFGTKRTETSYKPVFGFFDEWTSTYTSLPFGDGYGGGYGNSGQDGDQNHFGQLDGGSDTAQVAVHAQFRDYYVTAGRWLSPDPYDGSYHLGNPQSFNRYAYAKNNPLGKVDPSGREEVGDPDCGDAAGCSGEGDGGGGGGEAGGDGADPCAYDACVVADPDPPVDLEPDPGTEPTPVTPQQTGQGSLVGTSDVPCKNGLGTGGAGVGAGYNVDAGVGATGASSTGGVGAGAFHNSGSGSSGGLFATGGATAYAGSHNLGAPTQTSSTFTLGAYAGAVPISFSRMGLRQTSFGDRLLLSQSM
jgi:RHS repeat-associated protein